MDALKPFLMLACTAFVVGFMGYLGLARLTAPAEAPADSYAAAPASQAASAPVAASTSDDWNLGKRI
jgi:hypothetical protein